MLLYLPYVALGLLAVVLLWWLIRLIWLRPVNINHFYWRIFLQLGLDNPELLTMLGVLERLGLHGHNARLSDTSEAHEVRQYARLRRWLRMLRSYRRDRLSRKAQLSYDILEWFLDDQARGERFRHHDYPLNQMFGIQSSLPNFMMTMHPLTGRVEARNYVRRLRLFPVKFGQVLHGLRLREAEGIVPPRFVIRRVLDEMEAFIGQPARENPLFSVFVEKTARLKLPARTRARLQDDVAAAIEAAVYPAYRGLIDYFRGLESRATDDDGVWKLPDGEAFYAHCLRSSTTTDLTPDEVHAIGLREVARIEAEMEAILNRLGHVGDAPAPRRLNALARDERFLFPNTEEGRAACLAEYQAILDHINANLGDLFDLRPAAGVRVERIPEFREKTSAGAYYQPGSLDGSRPGVFYANLRDMREVPRFGMKTLAYHEAIPGHHFQISIAQQLRGLPFFRRLLPFTAYVEGWALYAEKLAREYGFYRDDPYGELGYLDSELFRAVRLVVDTGIHAKRWTREQAIAYMEAHTAQAHESVVSEVERYIVMPGQACAYKIGEIRLVQLREKARAALGERFDIRRFHNVVLGNGAMPLTLLERLVDEYISSTRKVASLPG